MASKDAPKILIADLRGGRNGGDSPFALPETQCVEAENVHFFEGNLGTKRGGSDSLSLTFGSGGPFDGPFNALVRHLPSANEALSELWAIDDATPPLFGRLAGGTTWAVVTPKDEIASRPQDLRGVSFNGKLFLAFDSAVDRLHVWDGTSLRRTGLGTPAAATVANTGSGSYAATIRYYKIAYRTKSGSVVLRQSELSASVSFTPSGSGTAARVTKPAAINEGETHWVLFGATADAGPYYELAETVVGTTTYDDSTAPSAYSGFTDAPEVGTYVNWTSVKYLLTDGNRLLGAGSWETSGLSSRVWFSPVQGASDVDDDERVPETTDQQNYIDVNENAGGFITGLGGPLEGSVYVFKYREIWKLVPTGVDVAPYLARNISPAIGAINQASIVNGRDYLGNPAIYFLAQEGPYRVGVEGLEYLGRDVEDIWETVNLDASSVVSHGIYYADLNQIRWWVSTGSDNTPDTVIVFDIIQGKSLEGERVRGGWSKFTGTMAEANCSVMFASTVGASMSANTQPYVGLSSATATILKTDTSTKTDNGTAFRGYIRSRPYTPAGLARNFGLEEGYLAAGAASGVTIRLNLIRDMGAETRTSSVVLTPEGSETHVLRKFEASDLSGAWCAQFEIGDAEAVSSGFTLEGFTIPVTPQEAR